MSKFFSNNIPYYLNQSSQFKKKKNKYTAPLFPPKMNSILGVDKFGNYIDKKNGKNKMKELLENLNTSKDNLHKKIYWKRISELKNNNYSIFEKEIDCTKFKQGDIGNCYFISTVAILSNYSQLIIQLFGQEIINNEGYYEICLFIKGHWQIVIIDDYIPFYKKNDDFVFAKPAEGCYGLFLCLLEKAWAKINGGYANIISGNTFEIYELLTGFNSESLLDNYTYNEIRNYILNGHLISFSYKEHAYSVLNTHTYNYNSSNYKLIQVRDPYGTKKNINNLPFQIEYINEEKKYEKRINQGMYWLDFEKIKGAGYEICYLLLGAYVESFFFNQNNNSIINLSKKGYTYFRFQIQKQIEFQLNVCYDEGGLCNSSYFCNNLFINEKIYKKNIKIKPGTYIILIEWEDTKNLGINFYTSQKINIDYIGTFTKDKQNYEELLNTKENNPSTYISFQYADNLNQKIMLYKDILNVLEKNMEYKIPLDSKGYFIETKNNDEVLCIISIKKDDLNDLNIASMNKGETEIYYGKQHHDGKVYGEGSVWNDGKMIFQGFINDNSYEKQFGIKLLDNEEEEENNDYVDVILNMKKIPIKISSFQRKFPSHRHPLTLCETDRGSFGSGWICNYCSKTYSQKIKSYYCTLCDYDLCIECSENNNINSNNSLKERVIDINGALWQFKYEEHIHPLTYTSYDKNNEKIKCEFCIKEFEENNFIYFCSVCDYNICLNCKNIIENGKKWQFKTSWHIHPLSLFQSPRSSDSYLCNHCGETYLKSDLSFYCTLCDFDICMNCSLIFQNDKNKRKEENKLKQEEIPENGFYFQISGVHTHPLTECYVRKGIDCNENWICKKCKTTFIIVVPTYYCSLCDIYYCEKCCGGREKINQIYQIKQLLELLKAIIEKNNSNSNSNSNPDDENDE